MKNDGILVAPAYEPATNYVPPRRLSARLSTRTTAIATLKSIPEAWAIVEDVIPTINMRTSAPQIIPHLGNFSLHSVIQFGIVQPEELANIDDRLPALGEFE